MSEKKIDVFEIQCELVKNNKTLRDLVCKNIEKLPNITDILTDFINEMGLVEDLKEYIKVSYELTLEMEDSNEKMG